MAIAVDHQGNVYVAGNTDSSNFPTETPYDPSLTGSQDIFVTKLNAAGTELIYSTYLGGAESSFYGLDEAVSDLAVDLGGNVYLTGWTNATNFSVPRGYQGSLGGDRDGFVPKLSAAGNNLVYSSYLGGTDNEYATGIAIDQSGRAYVTGVSASTDFATTSGAYLTTNNNGPSVFVTKLTPTGHLLSLHHPRWLPAGL